MENEKDVDYGSLTAEDFIILETLLKDFKNALYLTRTEFLPFDAFQDYVAVDIWLSKLQKFLKGD